MGVRSERFLPSKAILEPFRDLPNDDREVRINAAKSIILQVQAEEDQKEATINYALIRLIKGLNSDHDSSRLGFSMALTEFLRQIVFNQNENTPSIDFDKVIQLVLEHTDPTGNLPGQEERNHYFGRLFGLKAIIETDYLFSTSSSPDQWKKILHQLFQLGQIKSWLQETCTFTICNAIQLLPDSARSLLQVTAECLNQSKTSKTPGGIAIMLTMLKYHPTAYDKSEVDPLRSSNLPSLAKILKESTENHETNGQGATRKGNWNARLPFVWSLILDVYLSNKGKELVGRASFEEFWKIVVDENLFAAKSSDERKFWGFILFTQVVQASSNKHILETVFSKNFMKCLINQLTDTDRYLNKAANKALKALVQVAEENPTLVPIFVKQLLTNHGTPSFDNLTKTKTIEKMMSLANEEGLLGLVSLFEGIILNPHEKDVKGVEKRRQWAADQLLALIRNNKVIKSKSWIETLLHLFAIYGHFEHKSSNEILNLTSNSQAMFRTRLLSCLNAILENAELKDPPWSSEVVSFISEKEHTPGSEFVVDFGADMLETRNASLKTLKKIQKKNKSNDIVDPHLRAFELLYSLILLQVYNGDSEAFSVLDELQICYEKLVPGKKEKVKDSHRHKRAKADHDHEEEIDPSDMLMEILLSFVSKPSGLLRRLAQTVFTTFADKLTDQGLQSMIDVLKTKESLAGQSELFDEDDEDGDEEGSEGSDNSDELDSDVEYIDIDKDGSSDGEEINNDSTSSRDSDDGQQEEEDEEDEDEGEDDEEARKLDAALALALGTSKPAINGEDTTMHDAADSNSDSDESMNDDQMLALDDKLVTIFKHRADATSASKNKKQQQKEGKETIINFKSRVLELLEIYVKQCHTNPLVLEIILPLLELMRTTSTRVLANKAQNVVKALIQASRGKGGAGAGGKRDKQKKKSQNDESHNHNNNNDNDNDNNNGNEKTLLPTPKDPQSLLTNLLPEIHNEAGRGKTKEHAAACSQCSLLVVKVLVNVDQEYLDKVFEMYAKTMGRWMKDTAFVVQPSLFTDLVGWAGSVRGQFVGKKEEEEEKEDGKEVDEYEYETKIEEEGGKVVVMGRGGSNKKKGKESKKSKNENKRGGKG